MIYIYIYIKLKIELEAFGRIQSIIGFKNAKSLKDHLVRAVLPQLDREGRSKPCEGANRSCEVCDSVKDTTKFKKPESEETFDILKGPLVM